MRPHPEEPPPRELLDQHDVVDARHLAHDTRCVLVLVIPVPSAPVEGDAGGPRIDLVRLKLDAGGARDAWDIDALLDADDSGHLAADVEASLDELRPDARALWAEILSRRARRR